MRTPRRLSTFVLLALVAAPIAAQQAPAAPKAPAGQPSKTWEKAILEAIRPKPAGVNFDLSVTESPVTAATREEFVRTISTAADRMVEGRGTRSPGSSAWGITWRWEMETHLARCQFKDLSVRVTYTTDVAQLAGPVAQDSAAAAWWSTWADHRYAMSIDQLKLMRDAAKDIYQRMKLMTDGSCPELGNRATEVGRDRLFALRDEMQRSLGLRMGPASDPIPPQE